MIHRASLEGMLIAAQHAAAEVRSLDPAAAASSNFEVGLDRPDAENALAALRTMKSRQLEEDDNQLPHVIGSESLAWRQRFSSKISGGRNDMNGASKNGGQVAMLEASADDFFSSFPECRRRREDGVQFYSDMDESENEDDIDNNIDNQKPKAKKEAKKKGSEDQPVVVTCASSSPSPDRPTEKSKASNNGGMFSEFAATKKTTAQKQSKESVPSKQQQQQPRPVSSNSGPSNWGSQQHPNRNLNESNNGRNHQPYQQPQRQQRQSTSGNYTNHPNQRQQHRGPQHNQWQNDDPHQQNQSAFDYNDNNSYNNDRTDPAAKTNPFRTAKELGPNFDDRGGRGRGRGGSGHDGGISHVKVGRPQVARATCQGYYLCVFPTVPRNAVWKKYEPLRN